MVDNDSGSPNESAASAVARLQKLGLTEYEARIYVGLLRLGSGGAREIADVTTVPRTRIYDGTEALERRGLLDVRQSSPKVFRPVSRETIVRQFQDEYEATTSELSAALADLEPADRPHEQTAVWTVTGRETVTDRATEFINDAEEELFYLTSEDSLSEKVIDRLAAAAERDVRVLVAGATPASEERLRERVQSVETDSLLWDGSYGSPHRLFMTDRETILVSALTDGGSPTETAVWGGGEYNSLVVVLRAIFAWWLDDPHSFAED